MFAWTRQKDRNRLGSGLRWFSRRMSSTATLQFFNRPDHKQKTEGVYPFEAFIEPNEGGLPMRSKALLMQTRSLDKSRLTGYYGHLSEETMLQVDQALKVAAGLR